MLHGILVSLAAVLVFVTSTVRAQHSMTVEQATLQFERGLAIASVAETARRPINTDAVIAGLVEGTLDLATLKAGDELIAGKLWTEIAAQAGNFAPIGRGTYIHSTVTSAEERVMLLQASGHAMVYVNGEPRMGDPYSHGYVTLPVVLAKGENTFLFAHAGRGGMQAKLIPAPGSGIAIITSDLTLPSLRTDQSISESLGVPLINASTKVRQVQLHVQAGSMTRNSKIITLAPLSVYKASIIADLPASSQPLTVQLVVKEDDGVVAGDSFTLTPRKPGEHYSITYQSRVDGSTQYIAIVPPLLPGSGKPALVLSLHGASVEATNQANSYAPRKDTLIACPTNRRPFGFDWEDWGRIDALESLAEVARRYDTDPARQYLTGHSMGGHGTWNIAVLYPHLFAAIAPSAGWLSFDTYTSAGGPAYAPAGALGDVFRAARASSDTLTYFPNLRGKGIFILHGDKDDNVPVEQARQARAALDGLSIPYAFHEEPGAGHWWDNDQPGAACLAWPGIWETFDKHTLAKPATQSSTDPAFAPPVDDRGFPRGSFKRAFDREFVMIYATAGTEAENAWSLAKARFDAEQWWYRGNGRAVVMSDEQFLDQPTEGNVILYGHQDSNRAWRTVAGNGAAIAASRGKIQIRGKELTGDDLTMLAVIPRADRTSAEVGVITGTGATGNRAADRLGYFSSGVGFPEVTVLRASIWRKGFAGVEAAGALGQEVSK